MLARFLFYVILSSVLTSCYSFKGTSISPDLKSYYIEQTIIAQNPNAALTPGDMPEKFMEVIRGKVRDQSNLIYNDVSPDIEFRSTITQFELQDEARNTDNDISSLRKLVASIAIEYISNKDEEDNWKQTFTHSVFFDASTDFQSSQETFIDEILEQISEQAFNKSFTNW